MNPRVIGHRADDTQWLLDTGASPHEIARRLGYRNVNSLRRTMYRAGRQDLVDRLGPDTPVAWGTRAGMRRAKEMA